MFGLLVFNHCDSGINFILQWRTCRCCDRQFSYFHRQFFRLKSQVSSKRNTIPGSLLVPSAYVRAYDVYEYTSTTAVISNSPQQYWKPRKYPYVRRFLHFYDGMITSTTISLRLSLVGTFSLRRYRAQNTYEFASFIYYCCVSWIRPSKTGIIVRTIEASNTACQDEFQRSPPSHSCCFIPQLKQAPLRRSSMELTVLMEVRHPG